MYCVNCSRPCDVQLLQLLQVLLSAVSDGTQALQVSAGTHHVLLVGLCIAAVLKELQIQRIQRYTNVQIIFKIYNLNL